MNGWGNAADTAPFSIMKNLAGLQLMIVIGAATTHLYSHNERTQSH
jgi:hypothetical protein